MRLLFITAYYKPAFVYGGPVRSVAALCEGLVQAGVSVTVFTTNANGANQVLDVPTGQPMMVNGVTVYYFPVVHTATVFPFYAPALGQACKAQIAQFDAVYIYATWTYPMIAGGNAAHAAGIPYVVSPRGSFMTQSLQEKRLKKFVYYWLIERKLVRRAAAIHCTSELEQQQTIQMVAHPVTVLIPNGLDTKPFVTLPKRGYLRKKLGLPEQASVSLFVGRLASEKRLELTVEAFRGVAAQMPEAHLVLVGPEAGSGQAVQELSRTLNLQNRIHQIGSLTGNELLEAYADADLVVLFSRRENFGMAVVEAMAAGVPVLLANEVGLATQVAEAGAGWIVSSAPDEIAQKWRQLLSTLVTDRQAMGKRGQALVNQCFSQEVAVSQMYELFQKIHQQRIATTFPG